MYIYQAYLVSSSIYAPRYQVSYAIQQKLWYQVSKYEHS